MSQNAESFAPNTVVLDSAGDGRALEIKVGTNPEPSLVINLDGSILAGDGATAPTSVTVTLADLFPDAPVEVDPESVTLAADLFTALEALGLVVAPEA